MTRTSRGQNRPTAPKQTYRDTLTLNPIPLRYNRIDDKELLSLLSLLLHYTDLEPISLSKLLSTALLDHYDARHKKP